MCQLEVTGWGFLVGAFCLALMNTDFPHVVICDRPGFGRHHGVGLENVTFVLDGFHLSSSVMAHLVNVNEAFPDHRRDEETRNVSGDVWFFAALALLTWWLYSL